MYYKIVKDNQILDLVDSLHYIKISEKSGHIILCPQNEAQGIISSTGEVWHLKGFFPFPKKGYKTVDLIEIDEKEYHQLKALGGRTPEEIIDEYTLSLIAGGIL